jgi:hypothetical protein
MSPHYVPITPSNAKRILEINNRIMTAICQLRDKGCPTPSWGIADVSKRITECEAVLAAQRAKRDEARKAA